MPPMSGIAGYPFSGLSATTASVVRNIAATDAAFCSAERVALQFYFEIKFHNKIYVRNLLTGYSNLYNIHLEPLCDFKLSKLKS